MGKLVIALRTLPTGVLNEGLLELLTNCLERFADRILKGGAVHRFSLRWRDTAADQRQLLALLRTVVQQHRNTRRRSQLTAAERRSAISALLVLNEVLNAIDAKEPTARAVLWRCRSGLGDLTTRLQADQLERQALASRHLGDVEQARRCYRHARELLATRPQIARPHELDALAGQLAAA